MQHENILTNYEIMISFHVYSLKAKDQNKFLAG